MKKYKAKANANIALIKYWGKENEELIIPNTSSLSLSLEALYTETKVSFIDSDKETKNKLKTNWKKFLNILIYLEI